MPIKIALFISVLLQFAAAFIAIGMIRRTRANIAWWLISLGFLLMAVRRLFELFIVFDSENPVINGLLSSWIGVAISLIMLLSLMFIKHIFDLQDKLEEMRQKNEAQVLSAILRTEESERLRFAKDLHDGLGPLLSSVKLTVSALKRNPLPDREQHLVVNADKLIDEAIVSLKEISNHLSPHTLMNLGLLKAVKGFISNAKVPGAPRILLNSNLEERRYPFNTEVILYRVICELITNSMKHAHARHINIDLFDTGEGLTLDYFDDGQGFDPALMEGKESGMGINNIRSRIRSLSGRMDLQSRQGQGTNVTISIAHRQNEEDPDSYSG
ncbi:MAG TPA: sensor histidine kinase [Bacteroidales bacterium]|nr:sensor histidine kinase [Bacteroidales bacterium]HRZ77941.1 sensor histidine kinase [Bacteroidales bacterium]